MNREAKSWERIKVVFLLLLILGAGQSCVWGGRALFYLPEYQQGTLLEVDSSFERAR